MERRWVEKSGDNFEVLLHSEVSMAQGGLQSDSEANRLVVNDISQYPQWDHTPSLLR